MGRQKLWILCLALIATVACTKGAQAPAEEEAAQAPPKAQAADGAAQEAKPAAKGEQPSQGEAAPAEAKEGGQGQEAPKAPTWQGKRLHELVGSATRVTFRVFDPVKKETREGHLDDKDKIQEVFQSLSLGQELTSETYPECTQGIQAIFFSSRTGPLGVVGACHKGEDEGGLSNPEEGIYTLGQEPPTSVQIYRGADFEALARAHATELVKPEEAKEAQGADEGKTEEP